MLCGVGRTGCNNSSKYRSISLSCCIGVARVKHHVRVWCLWASVFIDVAYRCFRITTAACELRCLCAVWRLSCSAVCIVVPHECCVWSVSCAYSIIDLVVCRSCARVKQHVRVWCLSPRVFIAAAYRCFRDYHRRQYVRVALHVCCVEIV